MAAHDDKQAALERAARLARKHDTSMYVVWTGEEAGYAVASEDELDTYWLGASVVAEVFSDGSCVAGDT